MKGLDNKIRREISSKLFIRWNVRNPKIDLELNTIRARENKERDEEGAESGWRNVAFKEEIRHWRILRVFFAFEIDAPLAELAEFLQKHFEVERTRVVETRDYF